MTVPSPEWLSRSAQLMGDTALCRLREAKVAVFGVGGVGGYAVEVLARSGIGEIHLYDGDVVSSSNINRQLIATHTTVGRPKVEVAAERVREINPQCHVVPHRLFYLPENARLVALGDLDYVADCVDTITAKVELIRRCREVGVPLIVSMGAANKMDPTGFRVTELGKTKVDPLAKAIRKKLRGETLGRVKCVWSEEQPLKPQRNSVPDEPGYRPLPASNAFVPAAAGIVLGGEIIRDLIRTLSPTDSPV